MKMKMSKHVKATLKPVRRHRYTEAEKKKIFYDVLSTGFLIVLYLSIYLYWFFYG